jgi:hypothetical protein
LTDKPAQGSIPPLPHWYRLVQVYQGTKQLNNHYQTNKQAIIRRCKRQGALSNTQIGTKKDRPGNSLVFTRKGENKEIKTPTNNNPEYQSSTTTQQHISAPNITLATTNPSHVLILCQAHVLIVQG